MGDIVVAIQPEGGSSSIKCHVLTSTNYTVWAMREDLTQGTKSVGGYRIRYREY